MMAVIYVVGPGHICGYHASAEAHHMQIAVPACHLVRTDTMLLLVASRCQSFSHLDVAG